MKVKCRNTARKSESTGVTRSESRRGVRHEAFVCSVLASHVLFSSVSGSSQDWTRHTYNGYNNIFKPNLRRICASLEETNGKAKIMRLWKRTEKAKAKRKVQDPEKMMRQYNQFLVHREMLHRKLVDEAGRLERKRSQQGPAYVR